MKTVSDRRVRFTKADFDRLRQTLKDKGVDLNKQAVAVFLKAMAEKRGDV